MSANSSSHAFDHHFDGLFGTKSGDVSGAGASAIRAPRTLLVPGNLPVMGGLWIPQYADRVAVSDGPVGLLRLEPGLIRVQVLRGASQIAELDEELTLSEFLRALASEVGVWMIAAAPLLTKSVHREFSRLTTLTGADAPAVVACYEILRDQVQDLQTRSALEVRPSVGVVVVGADEMTSETAMRGLRKTAAAYLGFEVALEAPMPRIGSIVITVDREFAVEDVSVDAALRMIEDAERAAATDTAFAAHERTEDGREIGVDERVESGAVDGRAMVDAVIESSTLQRSLRDTPRGAPLSDARTADRLSDRSGERFGGRADRRAPQSSARSEPRPDTIPFEIWRRPSAMARGNAAQLRSAASAAPGSSPTAVATPSSRGEAHGTSAEPPRTSRGGVPATEWRVGSRSASARSPKAEVDTQTPTVMTASVGLPPKPASVMEVHSIDPEWPASLVPWMQGLTAFAHRSPYDPAVEIAVDERGMLHVVGRADELQSLLRVKDWIQQHASLLEKVEPQLDFAKGVTLDLVTQGLQRIQRAELTDSLGTARWHALIGVQVAGRRGVLVQPYTTS
jgi:hypothetical protein